MPDSTGRFRELMGRPEAEIPLDEAVMLVAAHANPALDVAAALGQLDALAAGVEEHSLAGLVAHLFVDLGFHGNSMSYGDPRNSYLDQVVARRTGIPITLSILAIEVGRRVEVPLVGIGMPGHFLVRHEGVPRVMVDPFAGGKFLDRDDAEARFHQVAGPSGSFRQEFLDPVGTSSIVARVLNNLRQVFTAAGDRTSLAWALRLRALVPGGGPAEKLELARALADQAGFVEAAGVMDGLAADLRAAGDEVAAERAAKQAALLRARLN